MTDWDRVAELQANLERLRAEMDDLENQLKQSVKSRHKPSRQLQLQLEEKSARFHEVLRQLMEECWDGKVY